MSLAPLLTWQGGIGRVADQVVLEAELLIAAQPRDGLSPDEVTSPELVEQLRQIALAGAHPLQRAPPEDFSHDPRFAQNCSLAPWDGAEPRRHDTAARR